MRIADMQVRLKILDEFEILPDRHLRRFEVAENQKSICALVPSVLQINK